MAIEYYFDKQEDINASVYSTKITLSCNLYIKEENYCSFLSHSLSLCVCVNICIPICTYIYIYIFLSFYLSNIHTSQNMTEVDKHWLCKYMSVYRTLNKIAF